MIPPPSETKVGEALKHWKNLISPLSNFILFSPIFMKGLLAICFFSAVSICCFSIFPSWKPHAPCPECDRIMIYESHQESINGGHEEKTNISHILFGIGGSAATWSTRLHYYELWWKPGTHRGFVWLDEKPGKAAGPWLETSPPYKISADTSRFKYTCSYGSRSAVRIARIIKESFELGLDNVRWFVMGDDDTVFFTENLLNVLNKYDHNQMYYIGGNSESVDQDLTHSYTMGYGGGGFAVSYPLAAALVRILDGCIDRYADFYGSDQKIGGCMSEIGVPLTKELGFHQIDIRGSPYGLLSAHPLSPLVTLHHLDYVEPLFPGIDRIDSVKKLMNGYISDPSRALQHTFGYDPIRNWSVSIAWGYSVQLYPFLLTGKDLSTPLQTFVTWGTWSKEPFTFNTRVLNLGPCERPIIFYFDGVKELGDGNTLTWYRRPNTHPKRRCNWENYAAAHLVKGFNVSAALMNPQEWRKAPRRQCTEIMNAADNVDGTIEVRVRDCSPWESVTPQ
ncbi:uncharacterized protein [Primulina huaijiensis]|uniref:uncharacterized protein n=1 Tax=Primulina huaijiensis TaxID=1492673 RepID=UPI003CC7470A